MIIDLSSLAIITGTTFAFMAVALMLQFAVNKVYKGIGWWASGCLSMALAAVIIFIKFQGIPQFEQISLFSGNFMFLTGVICTYIGTARFLNMKENRYMIFSVYFIFISCTYYVVYVNRNDDARIIILYSALIVFILITVYNLIISKVNSIRISAGFTAAVFLLYAAFLLFRCVITLIPGNAESVFNPVILQISAFLFSVAAVILWTFGFITMVNQRLSAEIKDEKENFEHIFYSSPDATLLTRFDDRIIADMNEGFTSMSGFSRDECIGKTSLDLNIWVEPDDRWSINKKIEDKGICQNYEAVLRIKNGEHINVLISAKIVKLHGIQHLLIINHNITERKRAEEKIKTLLAEKELILKEVHHRIKNNMNNIRGLLALQSDTLTDASAKAALKDAENRVLSMMLLYDKLYHSAEFNELPATEYLPRLIDEIISSFSNSTIVKTETHISEFTIETETLFAIGIIVNEIITNIMKYAFTGTEGGVITVIASSIDGRTILVIGDNGKGMPEEIDFQNAAGFGLQLVNTLVKQLKGSIRMERTEGTRFIIDF